MEGCGGKIDNVSTLVIRPLVIASERSESSVSEK